MKTPYRLLPDQYIGKDADFADFKALLRESDAWLERRFVQLVTGDDLPGTMPSNAVVWQESIPAMSAALIKTIDALTDADPVDPPMRDDDLPVSHFATRTTARHADKCTNLANCLKVFKRLRKAYIDLASLELSTVPDRTVAIDFLNTCFDPCEIALCEQWDRKQPMEKAPIKGQAGRFFAAVYDNASAGICIITPEGTIALVNAKCCELFGAPAEHLAGLSIMKIIAPEDMEEVVCNMALLLSGEIDSLRNERHVIRQDGTSLHLDLSTAAIRDNDGNIESLVAVMTDISERKQAETDLMESERELRRYKELMKIIMNGTPMLMGYVNTDLRYKYVNSYYKELYDVDPEEVIGKRVPDLIGKDVFAKVERHYQKALNGETARFDLLLDSPKRGNRHLEARYLPHVFEGKTEGVIILILDVTDRKLAEQEHKRFFDVSPGLFYVAGFDGYFRQTNPTCAEISGWTPEELKSKKLINFIHPDDRRSSLEKFKEITKGNYTEAYECRILCKDGSHRWITWNSLPLFEEELVYAIGHDITDRRLLEEQLRTMATRDPLTKAMNRRHFFDLGATEFAKAKRYGHTISVFMLDIDHFKSINDAHGHLAGDDVLREVANICQSVLREGDLFCRYGGEEFSGILMKADEESARTTAKRLVEKLAAHVTRTITSDIAITASIGTATLSDDDQTIQDMLNRADTALYAAKKKGRNCALHL